MTTGADPLALAGRRACDTCGQLGRTAQGGGYYYRCNAEITYPTNTLLMGSNSEPIRWIAVKSVEEKPETLKSCPLWSALSHPTHRVNAGEREG